MSVFGLLCYTGRTSATFFRPFPFLPLSTLFFVLLGFLFKLLVGTAGQGRAGDDSGSNCKGGARKCRRRTGGTRRGGRSGHGDRVRIVLLQGPVGGERAGGGVSAGGALADRQVLGAAAFRGAG